MKPEAVNRRQWQRFASDLKGFCGLVANGLTASLPMKLYDVSAGGIGLLVKRHIQPGSVLVLKLAKPTEDLPDSLFLRVVHATPEHNGEWFLGCAFASPLAEEEVQALLP